MRLAYADPPYPGQFPGSWATFNAAPTLEAA
jgi:hypothetical protein